MIAGVGKQIASALSDLSSGLNHLIARPIRDLRQTTARATYTEGGMGPRKDKSGRSRSFLGTILRFPMVLVISILSIAIKILISPGELLVGIFKQSSTMILLALPSIAVLAAGTYYYSQTVSYQARILEYQKTADEKFKLGSYEAAVDTYESLMEMEIPLTDEERFQYALSLTRVDRDNEAQIILRELAPLPGGASGYPLAHQLAAVTLARALKPPVDPDLRAILKWHLDSGGETKDPVVNRAWAEYYLSLNEKMSAVRHMELAATVKPEFMVLAATIYQSMDDVVNYRRSLEKANVFFQQLVVEHPTNVTHRMMLSDILLELGDPDAAENTLLKGRSEKRSAELDSAIAAFYLRRYYETDTLSFADRFEYLRKCLSYDINYIDAYEAMTRLYRANKQEESGPNEKGREVIKTLRLTIETSDAPALAHFALSNILWEDDIFEESQFHMEKAYELDPKRFAVIANNLAWILAHADEPDLDRAYELSRSVCEKYPDNGRLRDTLATVLMKQKKYDQALVEFARSLPTVSSRPTVHNKMAEIYDAIGKPKYAEKHRARAKGAFQTDDIDANK